MTARNGGAEWHGNVQDGAETPPSATESFNATTPTHGRAPAAMNQER